MIKKISDITGGPHLRPTGGLAHHKVVDRVLTAAI